MTTCDEGEGGSKIGQNRVTSFMDGPIIVCRFGDNGSVRLGCKENQYLASESYQTNSLVLSYNEEMVPSQFARFSKTMFKNVEIAFNLYKILLQII